MRDFIIRRIFQTVITLFMVTIIVFTVCMILPGDPTYALIGEEDVSEDMILHLRHKFGLDEPLYVQYVNWLKAIISGDLGVSFRTRAHVLTLFKQRLPVTLELLFVGIFFALFIAIPLGIISALKSETWIDSLCTVLAVSGVAMPQYLLGMVFILLFSLWLDWLPSSGFIPASENLWLNIRGMIMPGIVLGAVVAGEVMRQLRSSMLEVLHEEYIQTARSKGLSEYTVVIKHALRNALIPVVTLLGLRIGRFVGGLVIIEVVFSMPGIGRLLMNAIRFQDYPVLQVGILIVATSVTLFNLLADISYSVLDPRIRYS